ncbi:hypothetical protein [Siccirubricoccus phaeus]|uniref:hypothetical protein n=1 Tax=Siccirubricoccus phaeus TaxID=2595053 RepID=UPI0011F12467|nr:hypothetical protein [Siccirubricoccus phaeus]
MLLLALGFRLRNLGASLWLDEAYSLWFASRPLDYLWQVVPRFEPHPPLYYTLLRPLLAFGQAEVLLRLPSLLASLALLPLAWRLGWEFLADRPAAGRLAGGLAALFLALAAPQIWYAQEARPYALFCLAYALLILAAHRLLLAWEAAGPWPPLGRQALLLALAGSLTCWLHNIGPVYVAAVMLPLGLRALLHPGRWRVLGQLVLANCLLLLSILPNLLHAIARSRDWIQGTWLMPLTLTRARAIIEELFGLGSALPGPTAQLALQAAFCGLALLGLLGLLRRGEGGVWRAALLASAAAGPVLAGIGISIAVSPVFLLRTALATTVPLHLLLAMGCALGFRGAWRAAPAGLVAAVFLLGATHGFLWRPAEDWRGAAHLLAEQAGAAEPVLLAPNDVELPIRHYLDRAGLPRRLLPVPAPYPAMGLPNRYELGSPAVPSLSATDVERLVAGLAGEPSLWLVERYGGGEPLGRALEAARPVLERYAFGPAITLRHFGAAR